MQSKKSNTKMPFTYQTGSISTFWQTRKRFLRKEIRRDQCIDLVNELVEDWAREAGLYPRDDRLTTGVKTMGIEEEIKTTSFLDWACPLKDYADFGWMSPKNRTSSESTTKG
jgi:hypothetical protein